MLIGIDSCVLLCKLDINKQKGYSVNLKTNNFENKLYHSVNVVSLNNLIHLSSCLYINAKYIQKFLNTKLISKSANHKDSKILINPKLEVLLLTY